MFESILTIIVLLGIGGVIAIAALAAVLYISLDK
jgi:hypothetical protein